MNLSTTKEHLAEALGLAERIVGKKESLPVLSCVLLEAKGKTLMVRATNLEAGIEVSVPCNIESDGVVAVPSGVISQTIRSFSSDTITLREQDGNLSVEARGSKNLI